MEIIGCVSQKGGCGKSTLARLIAVNYALAGWNVKIADMDLSQGTCLNWNGRRLANGIEPSVSVEQFGSVRVAIERSINFDMVVFDGAPHSTSRTLDIAQASNLILLPSGTSLDDLYPTVLLAHELISKGIPKNKIAVVFSRMGGTETELRESQNYIHQAGYQYIDGIIPDKTAIRNSMDQGRCATETPYQSVNSKADECLQGIVNKLLELTK